MILLESPVLANSGGSSLAASDGWWDRQSPLNTVLCESQDGCGCCRRAEPVPFLSSASACKPACGSSRTPSRLSQKCVLLCRLLVCCSLFVRLQMSQEDARVYSRSCWLTSLGKGGFLENFGSSFMPDTSATAAQLKGLLHCFYRVCTFTFGYSFDWKVHMCVHIWYHTALEFTTCFYVHFLTWTTR